MSKVLAKFTPYAIVATKQAEKTYPKDEQHNARGDAYRHLVWQALVAKNQSPTLARVLGAVHESPIPFIGGGLEQDPEERAMDSYNNSLGIEIAKKSKTDEDIYRLAKEYVDSGKAKYIPVEELRYRAAMDRMSEQEEAPYR